MDDHFYVALPIEIGGIKLALLCASYAVARRPLALNKVSPSRAN